MKYDDDVEAIFDVKSRELAES
jgi:hypothetical protein